MRVRRKGNVSLAIRPTAAGKRVLAKRHRLSVKVKVTFVPTGGKPKSTTKTVLIKQVKRKPKPRRR